MVIMKRLNRRGYLTIEIILGATIAFAIAFLLIEITAKMVSDTEDNYKDTIIQTDTPLIISGVKEVIESHDNGIESIENRNDGYEIKYKDGKTGYFKIDVEKNKIVYSEKEEVLYERELDSSLSDIGITISVNGNIDSSSNIYIKIIGKNIFTDKYYDIIIPIENKIISETPENPSEPEKSQILAKYITELYTNANRTEVINNEVEYNYAKSEDLMNDRLGGTISNLDGGNVRYYGASPNNYIYFNCSDYSNQTDSTCEKWRIIGVFDGKAKIMRGSSIGSYSWDTGTIHEKSKSNCGINEWSQADTMKLLNSGYESEKVGGSLYWNSKSGTCYNGWKNATTTCDFTSTGLKNDVTRDMISETTYYTRGYKLPDAFANNMYDIERVSGTVITETALTRNKTWSGKVALLYPSDYGYAADLSLCQQKLFFYNDATCANNNWMKTIMASNKSWLLTPSSEGPHTAWRVNSGGDIYYALDSNCNPHGIFPVLHLDSEVKKNNNGDGSIDSPYQISLN